MPLMFFKVSLTSKAIFSHYYASMLDWMFVILLVEDFLKHIQKNFNYPNYWVGVFVKSNSSYNLYNIICLC